MWSVVFSGPDGSLMLDKFEFVDPANAYDAFALFVRTVLTEFARFEPPLQTCRTSPPSPAWSPWGNCQDP
jgi:hypothetical protein